MTIAKSESIPYGGSVIRLLKLCALYVNDSVPAFSFFPPIPVISMYHIHKSIPKRSPKNITHHLVSKLSYYTVKVTLNKTTAMLNMLRSYKVLGTYRGKKLFTCN